jgi:hypothetical protein
LRRGWSFDHRHDIPPANKDTERQNKGEQQSVFQANDLRAILKDQNRHHDRGDI